MGTLQVNGNITSNNTGARLNMTNGTTHIWVGINTDGTNWGIYNVGTSTYILRLNSSGTNFFGNADTATKLKTARTISLTGSVTGSGSFDGSGNLSISTTTNHTHNYLPLSGGTITGSVTFSKSNNYYDIATGTGGSILLNNGDIGGVNSIYFKDAANGNGEGLLFYRSATTVDSLRAYNGALYFAPNYDPAAGTQTGTYTVIHSGNYTSYLVDSKVTQSVSTATNWRPILLHYTNTSQGTDPGTATNQVYYNAKAAVNPSTGGIYSAGTITCNRIIATSTTDAAAGSNNAVALTLGSTSGYHIVMDGNEIIAKNANTSADLYLQSEGGTVRLGVNNITVNGGGAGSVAVMNCPGRVDMGCLCLTNAAWTGYGTADPASAGLTGVEGRVYFKIIG